MKSTSRRAFLKSSAALGGALVIPFWLPQAGGRLAHAQAPAPAPVNPNAFLRIGKDGTCTVFVKHLEMGQGVMTSLPMLVAEELECDWSKVRAELAPAAPEYAHTIFGMQMTGGSSSVVNSYDQLRTVGAQARTMLMQAAADQWKVKLTEVRAEKGFVTGPGGKRLSYGQLSEAAAKLPVPQQVALKDPKDFKIIGKPTRRIDSADKVTGKAMFGLDVQRKNLHTAVVLHRPTFGSVLKSFSADKVKAVPGVTHVVEIRGGVAVVAKSFWAAKTGRDLLQVEWDAATPAASLDSAKLSEQMHATVKTPGKVAKAGKPEALQGAAKTVVAEYEVPFLAHAPMEPLNCTVEITGDSAEIWVGSQFQTVDQGAAAKALGVEPSKVKLHTMLAGGGFGRRANPASDYIVEACQIAKSVKVPVKVVWTREDDIKGGYYRPAYVHRVEAAIDAQNRISGWNHTIVGGSIIAGTAFEPMMVKDGIDPTSTEGVADTPYDIPNLHVTLHTVETGVPMLWWRSVGHSHSAFVMETMIDELAQAAGKDPVAFRRELLAKHPRVLRVLDLAAEKSGWGSAPPRGRGRGIAVHEAFGSVCAQVAEVSLQGDAVRVHRVVAAFDCGLVVNPLSVEAQLQGAIAFGLSAALQSQITFKEGRVQQSNFHDYPVLRLNEMPAVEVHLVSGGDKPTGVGEPGVPPIAPAVANALFALTGKRARALPLSSTKWT
ncbi:MAG TPA: xanthine dehydrogenase family protein molybdopterin-binding subunit [Usitatibacter sp.]|nr:xanthine dehydrogenase family protein molybdopterin-binding subunit [Usitatibacter sp.]